MLPATVIGTGVMGAKRTGGNVALASLANTTATGAILVVLSLIFGPASGAQFNPAVSLAPVGKVTAWQQPKPSGTPYQLLPGVPREG